MKNSKNRHIHSFSNFRGDMSMFLNRKSIDGTSTKMVLDKIKVVNSQRKSLNHYPTKSTYKQALNHSSLNYITQESP